MAKNSPGNLALTPRVKDILRLLDHTPLPEHLIREASVTFGSPDYPEGEFTSDRRVRQKLQQLVADGLVSEHEFTIAGRGVMKFFQIAPAGFRVLYVDDPPDERRKFFRPVARLSWEHTYANARTIVKTLMAAHHDGIRVANFYRENELTLATGLHSVEPDHFFQFHAGGLYFNAFYEVDLNTETLDSVNPKSWRQRILAYEAYQDWLLRVWKENGKREPQARFRVNFLTTSTAHAYHFLSLARDLAANPARRLFYACTLDEYLQADNPLRQPILLDHHGGWQAIIDTHPTASWVRKPVRLPPLDLAPLVVP